MRKSVTVFKMILLSVLCFQSVQAGPKIDPTVAEGGTQISLQEVARHHYAWQSGSAHTAQAEIVAFDPEAAVPPVVHVFYAGLLIFAQQHGMLEQNEWTGTHHVQMHDAGEPHLVSPGLGIPFFQGLHSLRRLLAALAIRITRATDEQAGNMVFQAAQLLSVMVMTHAQASQTTVVEEVGEASADAAQASEPAAGQEASHEAESLDAELLSQLQGFVLSETLWNEQKTAFICKLLKKVYGKILEEIPLHDETLAHVINQLEPQLLCLLEQFVCWTIELSLWPNEGTLVALGQAVAAPMTASLLEIMEQSTASEEATTEAAAAVSDPVATVQQTEAVGELGSDSAVDLPQTSVVPAVLAALAPAGNESQTQAQDDGLNMPEVNVQQANVNETNIQLPLVAFGVEVPVPNVRLFGAE